jgi:agmatinase
MKKYGPADALESPRFCGQATFMRLPQMRTTDGVDVVILGLPFDTSVTYRVGSRFAPNQIRNASRLLRPYNPVHDIEIFNYCSAVDYGDVDIVPGYTEKSLLRTVEAMQPIFNAGVIPIAMGGDHCVTLAELRAANAKYGKLALIHFDSHSDVWDEYFGEKLSHGTPFRRALEENLLRTDSSIQIGIRGPLYSASDLNTAKELGFEVITGYEMSGMTSESIVGRIRRRVQEHPVFLSFDIDFVDPAYAPGTGTPEVGGPSSRETLEIVRGLTGLKFVGFDVVEVLPQYDHGEITSLLASNIMYEFLSLVAINISQNIQSVG